MSNKSNSPGRPPKFNEARRPITVTLPERTLQQLAAIHGDRARAIVKAAATTTRMHAKKFPPVEVVEMSGQALLVLGPCRSLRQITWLKMVEIAPSRFLLVVPSGTPIESLEVAIQDLLVPLPPEEGYEHGLLSTLLHILRSRRRQQHVTKAELLLLQL